MKKASYKILFNRRNYPKEKGVAPVEIEICINRKQKIIPTGIRVLHDQWDTEKKCVVKHLNKVNYNTYISKLYQDLINFETELNKKGEYLTIEKINALINKDKHEEFSFLSWVDNQIKSNTFLKESTKKQHTILFNKLTEFKKIKYFSDVNYEKIMAFDNWLRSGTEIERSQNTIHGYHKRLKIYVKKALASDLIQFDPYIKFKVAKGKNTEIKYLTAAELKRIEEKKIDIKRIDQVRDLFLFQCYTGLAYSDMAKLTNDHFVTDDDGNHFIKTYRTKTNEKSTIFILKKTQRILDKYKNKGIILPVITNQNYNVFLKELAIICNIDKNLTTHVGRHTFATTVTLSNGISIETVSKALGHASLKTTQIYAKIVEERIATDMSKIDD